MYTEVELMSVQKQLRKMLLLVGGILLVFLVAAFIFMTQWPAWIGIGFLITGVCFNIFLWSIYGVPILSYYRFVRDIVTGRTREMKGRVVRIVEEPIYKDNRLFYYEIWVDDEGVERVLYYDMNKGMPVVEAGTSYTFKIHENFIVDIMV